MKHQPQSEKQSMCWLIAFHADGTKLCMLNFLTFELFHISYFRGIWNPSFHPFFFLLSFLHFPSSYPFLFLPSFPQVSLCRQSCSQTLGLMLLCLVARQMNLSVHKHRVLCPLTYLRNVSPFLTVLRNLYHNIDEDKS